MVLFSGNCEVEKMCTMLEEFFHVIDNLLQTTIVALFKPKPFKLRK